MLQLPPSIQAQLEAEISSLCWCWRLQRPDGLQLGFTDHDRALVLEGLAFEPQARSSRPDADMETGLAPDQAGMSLALDDARVSLDDLQAGLWDETRVELLRADWTAPDQHFLVQTWWFGSVSIADQTCEVELVGREHRLERQIGRVFARSCDARLGDTRCGVSTSHVNFNLGCDRSFQTCRDRFANTLNFRGFPYLVGNDVLIASPASERVRDGGSRGQGGSRGPDG